MKHQLFIHIHPARDEVSWVRCGDADGAGAVDVRRGPLAEAAADAAGARVVVIVPAEAVVLTRARVPGRKSRSVLRQAVPFLLEDQLLDEVEALHFAFGPVEEEQVAVAVVARERMDGWLAELREAGIEPHAMIPEPLALPLESDAWTLVSGLEEGRLLLRTGPYSGMALEVANAQALLQAALEECDEQERPATLAIYECGDLHMNLPDLDLEQTRVAMREALLTLMVAGYRSTPHIDLLQGHYSRRERIGQYWRPWKVPLALTAALLLVQVGGAVVEYQRLATEKSRLWNEIVATYKKAFPGETNVPYPQRQMEEHLKRLRGGGEGAGGVSFVSLLARAGQHLRESNGLTLKRIAFKGGQLDVALTIGDLQRLDRLKQKLESEAGLEVEIVSAASRGKQVEARLRISEKKA